MKILLSFILLLSLTFNTQAAGGGKLLDLIVNESGLVELLTKNGIEGAVNAQVRSYVKNSILSLTAGGAMPSGRDLMKVINGLSDSADDRVIKRNLMKLLAKDSDSVSKKDVVEAVNNLIYLANRHGVSGSVVLACSECVNNALFSHGFKFTLEEVSQASVRQLLESNVIPRDPRTLSRYISDKMSRLGYGNFTKASADLVGPEEEKALAIFLALAEKGSPATKSQREFIDAVIAISTSPSGEVKLLDPANPHKFWKFLNSNENTDSVLNGYASLLRETAEEGKSSASKKEAFYTVLQRNAGNDPEAAERVNDIRLKDCFFGR